MLILCSGPDTLSARKKARELVEAFRSKYDPASFSIEVMSEPDISSLLNRLSAPSFFSTKRLIRCDGLIESLKIQDLRKLLTRLETDKDQTIVVSVEEEQPTDKIIKECQAISFFHYPFPLLAGKKFEEWCLKRGSQLGVASDLSVQVAQATLGDTWLAEQELMKRVANPLAQFGERDSLEGTVYDVVDSFLRNGDWRTRLDSIESEQFLATAISQTRSAIRVRDRETAGLHPYVVKKLATLRVPDIEQVFLRTIRAHAAARSGLAQSADEVVSLL